MWYFYIKLRVMIVFPKAKINLGLRIKGKRTDGYHDIETLFYPVNLSDALEFVISDKSIKEDNLTVTGLNTGGRGEDNLVMKAIKKLHERYTFPYLKMHLHKAIPAGAGLGGGSSDAACLIKSVIKKFSLSINKSDLNALALEIGSDCPFFIDYEPASASGRGEVLIPIKPVLSGYHILLLNPGMAINTGDAYEHTVPSHTTSTLSQLVRIPIKEWKNWLINDFEEYAFNKYPLIEEIKDELYSSGALCLWYFQK
jgi:4-diphosphocytidyl-2-C-methyl-D-erythritol kinase